MIDRRKTERRRVARKTRQFGRFLKLVERRDGWDRRARVAPLYDSQSTQQERT